MAAATSCSTAPCATPSRLLIGYETKTKATRLMLQRIERAQARPGLAMADLWLSDDDARFNLPRVIGDGRVDIFHILFPDPWWKTQHIVKRLFSPPFVDLLAAKLRPGGLLHFKSDVQEYGELVRYLVEGHGAFGANDPALGRAHRPVCTHAPRALVPGARQTGVRLLLRAQVEVAGLTLRSLRFTLGPCLSSCARHRLPSHRDSSGYVDRPPQPVVSGMSATSCRHESGCSPCTRSGRLQFLQFSASTSWYHGLGIALYWQCTFRRLFRQ